MTRFFLVIVFGLAGLAWLQQTSPYGWRRNGTGIFPDAAPPTEWGEKKNIKWQATVGVGHSSPIVAGDRVIVLAEPGTLWCLSRAEGKPLWKSVVETDVAPELKAKLREPTSTKEHARATPVTDGKDVYVALTNGLVSCFSLEGKRRWIQTVEPPKLTYGPSASPVLVGDKLLVDSTHLTALEAATGRVLWDAKEDEPHYGTPAIIWLEGAAFAVTAKGAVVRVSDGAVLAKGIASGLGGDQAPTPVVQDGVIYFAYRLCSAVKLAMKDGKLQAEKLWERELPGDVIASPVLHDGMLFVIPSEMPEYRVLNVKTGEVLLGKTLDLSTKFYPSLALAGKHLFLGNDKGDMVVLEPGREYKEIHRNELPEGSGASPVFAGPNAFLRGAEILYCVGR